MILVFIIRLKTNEPEWSSLSRKILPVLWRAIIVECIRKNGDGSLVVSGAIAEGSSLAGQRHVSPSDGDNIAIARQNTLNE